MEEKEAVNEEDVCGQMGSFTLKLWRHRGDVVCRCLSLRPLLTESGRCLDFDAFSKLQDVGSYRKMMNVEEGEEEE